MIYKGTYRNAFVTFAQTFASFAVKKNPLIIKMFFFLIIALKSFTIFGQETKLSEIIINIAEDLAASESDQEAAAAYIDLLYELAENPVNLNSDNPEEIERLFFLSDFQVKALTDYTNTTGRILTFNELAYIPGFDRMSAEMIMPFSILDFNDFTVRDSVKLRNSFITNFSVKTGNRDTTFLGSPLKVLTKYKLTGGSFSGGLTVEKDQGEKILCPGTISPDFFSANIAYTGNGLIKKIILGDYSARFGQGTNINTGISRGLSLTSQGYMSGINEIKPYTSSDENIFFRGIAASLSIRNIEASLFCSRNKIDATLGISPGSSGCYIDNLYRSGTHNTPDLLLKRDAVNESVYGINLSYNFKSVKLGLVWSETRFSYPVKPDYNNPENIFSFSGVTNSTGSLYYNGMIKSILLYGEISANDNKKHAIVQGLSIKPSDRLRINFLFWKYSRGYISFHGKGPGGSSVSHSEQSILGISPLRQQNIFL